MADFMNAIVNFCFTGIFSVIYATYVVFSCCVNWMMAHPMAIAFGVYIVLLSCYAAKRIYGIPFIRMFLSYVFFPVEAVLFFVWCIQMAPHYCRMFARSYKQMLANIWNTIRF